MLWFVAVSVRDMRLQQSACRQHPWQDGSRTALPAGLQSLLSAALPRESTVAPARLSCPGLSSTAKEREFPWCRGECRPWSSPRWPRGRGGSAWALRWCPALLSERQMRSHAGAGEAQLCLGWFRGSGSVSSAGRRWAEGLDLLVCMWPAETFLSSDHPSSCL